MAPSLIQLRALEPADIDFIFDLENDTKLWHLSHTQQPFSKALLAQYIQEADRDIYEAKQFRFAIEKEGNELIGFVDLFDFDPKNRRAGIGIIIKDKALRGKGYGKAGLQKIIDYSFNVLFLHQLYANISSDNAASIQLFESAGFVPIGKKKEWNFNGDSYQDECLYQLINKK